MGVSPIILVAVFSIRQLCTFRRTDGSSAFLYALLFGVVKRPTRAKVIKNGYSLLFITYFTLQEISKDERERAIQPPCVALPLFRLIGRRCNEKGFPGRLYKV